jgi:hypothetical protein
VRDGAEQGAQGLAGGVQIGELAQLGASEQRENAHSKRAIVVVASRDASAKVKDARARRCPGSIVRDPEHAVAIIPGHQAEGQHAAAQGDQITPPGRARRGGHDPQGFRG